MDGIKGPFGFQIPTEITEQQQTTTPEGTQGGISDTPDAIEKFASSQSFQLDDVFNLVNQSIDNVSNLKSGFNAIQNGLHEDRFSSAIQATQTQGASQVNYSPPANSWDDVEQRMNFLEARLRSMNTPEAMNELQQLQQLRQEIQDLRSNPFNFLPSQDILNRLQTIQNQTFSLQQPAVPQTTTDPTATTDPTPTTDSTATANVQSTSQLASPVVVPNSWEEMDQQMRFREAQLRNLNTPEAQNLLQQFQQLQNDIDAARSNPFNFIPNQDLVNRLVSLENQTNTLLSQPPPQQVS